MAATSLKQGIPAPEVVLRHHGPLGPILRERHAWLQDQGLLEGDVEEMLVICGRG